MELTSNLGVLAHVGSSEIALSNCTLQNNFIASGVDDDSILSISRCCFHHNLRGAIYVGDSAEHAQVFTACAAWQAHCSAAWLYTAFLNWSCCVVPLGTSILLACHDPRGIDSIAPLDMPCPSMHHVDSFGLPCPSILLACQDPTRLASPCLLSQSSRHAVSGRRKHGTRSNACPDWASHRVASRVWARHTACRAVPGRRSVSRSYAGGPVALLIRRSTSPTMRCTALCCWARSTTSSRP